MDRPWDDCRFFVTSGCRNANCKFRHSEAAKKNPTCSSWENGKCKDMACPKKHAIDIGSTPCRFEFSPSGCTNASCSFKHTLPRNTDSDLQQKLALFLAEHEKSKQSETKIEKDKSDSANEKSSPPSDGIPSDASDASDSECDLEALRAQALKTQVIKEKTQIIKRKGLSPNKDTEVIPPKIMKKTKVQIQRRLGERIQLNTTKDDGPRRVIKSKSQYSEDEVSDLSLDELTDEEPEDLRATLNKNKHLIRISKPNNSKSKSPSDNQSAAGRLIRKVDNSLALKASPTKKSPIKKSPIKNEKTGSRVIRMKKEETKTDSRPSSSEWIERTISVSKPKAENKILNRLVTGISQSESDYSDATQSDDSLSKSTNRSKPKRKPNMAWCNIKQNNATEDDDLTKRKTSSDNSDITYEPVVRPVEFTRKISVKGSVQSRLGSNVKSRLGTAPVNQDQSVKKRIGVPLKSRLGKESSSLGQRLGQISESRTTAVNSSNAVIASRDDAAAEQTQPKKKKLILIKRKQPREISETTEVEAKKARPLPETLKEKSPPPKATKCILSVTNQKPAKVIPEVTSPPNVITPKVKKATKVSITDDLEDELLEGEDDLELGNEISDDELFDL